MDIFEKTKKFYTAAIGEKRILGKSVLGREIFAVRLGEGSPVGIAQYAIHGRERITAELAFAQYDYGLEKGSVWLIPLLNPDGALISECGIGSVRKRDERLAKELSEINGGKDFSLWKANARGVDLNVNFDADWGTGKRNVRFPARENYIGEKPFSEPETQALRRFTEEIRPDFTVSYHTKGEEIYWYYYQPLKICARDKRIALALSADTGYPLRHVAGSAGGYKDWCIKKIGIPAFTVEVGKECFSHPLGRRALADIRAKNLGSLRALTRAAAEEAAAGRPKTEDGT